MDDDGNLETAFFPILFNYSYDTVKDTIKYPYNTYYNSQNSIIYIYRRQHSCNKIKF